jgi:hypothetical protein
MPGGPKPRIAICHPDRKHHAKGYCSSCYRVHCRSYGNNPVQAKCHPDRPHKARGMCESCYTAWKNRENPERLAHWSRAATLRVYGLTPEQYNVMYVAQSGLCAICKKPPKQGQVLHVDHDHQTERVRGLLCLQCNNGLGSFRDNPELLAEAQVYLTKTNLQQELDAKNRQNYLLI